MRIVFNFSDPFEWFHTQNTHNQCPPRHTILSSAFLFYGQNLWLLPKATLARNEFVKNDTVNKSFDIEGVCVLCVSMRRTSAYIGIATSNGYVYRLPMVFPGQVMYICIYIYLSLLPTKP